MVFEILISTENILTMAIFSDHLFLYRRDGLGSVGRMKKDTVISRYPDKRRFKFQFSNLISIENIVTGSTMTRKKSLCKIFTLTE